MLIIAHKLEWVRESAVVGMSVRDSYQYTTDKPSNSKHRHCEGGLVTYSTESLHADLSAEVLWDTAL